MLESIVSESNPQSILFLIYLVSHYLVFFLDELDESTPSDDCVGEGSIASSNGLELRGKPVRQPQSLLVNVPIFAMSEPI